MMFFVLLTGLYLIQLPVVEMREIPDKAGEVVSESYFSEEVQLLDEEGGWQKIETTADHYVGWIQKGALILKREGYEPTLRLFRQRSHIYAAKNIHYGPLLTLPFDSRLEFLEEDELWITVVLPSGEVAYIQRGDMEPIPKEPLTIEEICAFSQQFIGLPYTWGGRSSFGYDCSGFVQMLYRQMGISLPRDSKDQIHYQEFIPIELTDIQAGDLLFFGFSSEKIRHVGLYLGNDLFISATTRENAPTIHISNIHAPDWNGSGYYPYHAARRVK